LSARIATPAPMSAVGLAIVADGQAGASPVFVRLCEALRSNPGFRSLVLTRSYEMIWKLF